ncbi:unnamed protein product, partial [Discosporangium mesarthrocarpum]
DITILCREAAAQLGPDEIIHGEHFLLFDAMSALELMDPKMDKPLPATQSIESRLASGALPTCLEDPPRTPVAPLTPAPAAGPTSDGLVPPVPPSAVTDTLKSGDAPTAEECLLDILDGMAICEVAWHDGGSLPETLYTCLYLHPQAYSVLMQELGLGPLPPPHGQQKLDIRIEPGGCSRAIGGPRSWMDKALTLALLAHTLGTLRCCSVSRDVIILADIYEEEDFHPNTYGFRLAPAVEDSAVLGLLGLAEGAVRMRV